MYDRACNRYIEYIIYNVYLYIYIIYNIYIHIYIIQHVGPSFSINRIVHISRLMYIYTLNIRVYLYIY